MPNIKKKSCERFLSMDELRALLSQASPREHVVLRTLAVCGLRPADSRRDRYASEAAISFSAANLASPSFNQTLTSAGKRLARPRRLARPVPAYRVPLPCPQPVFQLRDHLRVVRLSTARGRSTHLAGRHPSGGQRISVEQSSVGFLLRRPLLGKCPREELQRLPLISFGERDLG